MFRPDGTYDLPDEKVSRFWESCEQLCVYWDALAGSFFTTDGDGVRPQPGRWLPWTPPTFPTRKKTELRRAKVRVDLCGETIGVRTEKKRYQWSLPIDGEWNCRHDSEVTVLEWLDPEYEDEL